MDEAARRERDPVYRMAQEILDREWQAAGMTVADLERSRQVTELLLGRLAAGEDLDGILARWEHLTPGEILATEGATGLLGEGDQSGAGALTGSPLARAGNG